MFGLQDNHLQQLTNLEHVVQSKISQSQMQRCCPRLWKPTVGEKGKDGHKILPGAVRDSGNGGDGNCERAHARKRAHLGTENL